MTNMILYELLDLHLVYESAIDEKSDHASYLPAEDINKLSVATVLYKLGTEGTEDFKIDRENLYSKPWKTLENALTEYYHITGSVLLKDL